MLSGWVADHPGESIFVESDMGVVTYGDVRRGLEGRSRGRGQVVIEPEGTLRSLLDLVTVPGPGTQMVVVDPRLPATERRHRRTTAAAAAEREAATVLFTSGSTGPAKAVRLTTDNWAAATGASAGFLAHTADDVWLAAMPLHHVGGLSILYRTALVGASVRWMPEFDAAAVAAALRREVTLASFVPTMLRRILDHDEHRYAGLKAVLVGGAPIPDGLLEEAAARGIPAVPTYGMTETCALVAALPPGEGLRYAVRPLPGVELRIDGAGRIEVRGRQVSPGYADAEDRPDGEWFTTPDLGEIDDAGYLRVTGRLDDIIITGGENVDPARVESVLASHPGVTAAAVVGVDDPEWGQRVAAVYVGNASAEDLTAFARTHLAAAEVPRPLRQVEQIPSGALGKPDKHHLRQMLDT